MEVSGSEIEQGCSGCRRCAQEPWELWRIRSVDTRWDRAVVWGAGRASVRSGGFQGWTKVSFRPLPPSTA